MEMNNSKTLLMDSSCHNQFDDALRVNKRDFNLELDFPTNDLM